MNCYYVVNIGYTDVVTKITDAGLFAGFDVTTTPVGLLLKSFAQCDTLKEARALRRQNGGIILKGIK